MTIRFLGTLTRAAFACGCLATAQARAADALDGEFWRAQGLTDIIPYWLEHARDEKYGGFYMTLSRRWEPSAPWDKYPAMIGRQVFGFSAAYLLSGEDKYLDAARQGVDYLLEHAWDTQYGGWFNVLTETGAPQDTSKSVDLQLYTDVGLTLYYFVTRDERVLQRVTESVGIRRTRAHDQEFGGYVQTLNRDLSVKDDAKGKHAHFGYTSSLLLNLSLATRDPEVLRFAEELMQISMERMSDGEEGWLRGFPTRFDRRWSFTPALVDGREVISTGAQLTAALAFLRLYELTGKALYRQRGLALGERIARYAWDAQRGGWADMIERAAPYQPRGAPEVSWWVQCYGGFLQLHLYHIIGEKRYLERFEKMAAFWNDHFVDRTFGGVFHTVSPDGHPIDDRKALVWKTSYHEMELALLNYFYLNLCVQQRPAVFHFRLRQAKASARHFASLVEDPAVRISAVSIDGQPWTGFDAAERAVILPDGKDLRMRVTLTYKP